MGGRQGGVGIVRSLGRLGVPVYGIDPNRFAPAFFSKYCRGKFLWDLDSAPVEESVRFLMEVGRKIGRRSVLIPTSDIGAMFVAEQAHRLQTWFIFPKLDAGLVRSLCSKKQMYYLAHKWSVHTPETSFPESRQDVLNYLEAARFPILLKPIYPRLPGSKGRQWRMGLVHEPQELLQRFDTIEDPTPNVMLQEYIPGADEMTWTFNGYFDRQGTCRVAFTGRKLRNFPPYFGRASLGICMKNDEVKETTIEFMKNIGYKGPLDLGYRYDVRDGRYKVTDINPRIGEMFRLFVGENGIDVVRALYQDMTGQPIVASVAPEGRKWIVEDVDLVSSLQYCRDGTLSLRQWIESLRGIGEMTYIARDDPGPFFAVCMLDLMRVLRSAELTKKAAQASGRRHVAKFGKARPTRPNDRAQVAGDQ
jgi:predicted ATP-grasp superfamily ATP-dependent carboligase